MEFRLANKDDLPMLEKMFANIVKDMHSKGMEIWNEYYPFEEFPSDIENKQLYLLMDNDTVVANFVLCKDQNLECFNWHNKELPALSICRLGVNVNYLKQGIGTQILNKAVELTKSKNVNYLRLCVVNNNIPAINLYKKFGFNQVDGIYKEYIPERNLTLLELGFEYIIN